MTIYQLKPAFQNLLRPLCRALAHRGITANQVTVTALLLSLATGATIWLSGGFRWALALLPAILLARMALNAVDGMLAREHAMQSSMGAILNELGDVLSDTALYLPLAIVPGLNPALMTLIVVLAVISEMTGVLAVSIGAQRRYDGPMGKSDRAFAFGLLALLLAAGISVGPWLHLVLGGILLLLLLTVVNRARCALMEVKA
ncbi:CDP-diacylglycerol--glycerol-3-phosphate 3-phosphatidyltransferase, putative [Syntrophotalea carbinolica DSM 2380]|uniref:CDP-diacylglycerol--glycerol-3-phosphate 3-phosphatidyltransferase, putative n=1 Tax=Syntrophotalea carbinolica (strain DSM 2380 / NBRC 103641 / GraBd1) TaxID=338963 RepID=Q3A0U5_SYNC1|nr:CDP-alcohol phosphatidyltransferase family protein [Syntrophotalea carbinolica]ABA90012.1 CDP-diacylglycerol--glycerol-3-phosphate 3-phosphatidyltransferase, putative [Syntrophotalea carbinolica DSM 2380]